MSGINPLDIPKVDQPVPLEEAPILPDRCMDELLDHILSIYGIGALGKVDIINRVHETTKTNRPVEGDSLYKALKDMRVNLDHHISWVENTLFPVIKIQSVIRTWNVQRNLGLIAISDNLNWQSIINSERVYVRQLLSVVESYQNPLVYLVNQNFTKYSANIQNDISFIFKNYSELLMVAQKTLEKLEQTQNNPILFTIGLSFINLSSSFSVYLRYITKLPKKLQTISKIRLENPEIDYFLINQQSLSLFPHISFTDLLTLPINQLNKYEDSLYRILHSFHKNLKLGYSDIPEFSLKTTHHRSHDEILLRKGHSKGSLGLIPYATQNSSKKTRRSKEDINYPPLSFSSGKTTPGSMSPSPRRPPSSPEKSISTRSLINSQTEEIIHSRSTAEIHNSKVKHGLTAQEKREQLTRSKSKSIIEGITTILNRDENLAPSKYPKNNQTSNKLLKPRKIDNNLERIEDTIPTTTPPTILTDLHLDTLGPVESPHNKPKNLQKRKSEVIHSEFHNHKTGPRGYHEPPHRQASLGKIKDIISPRNVHLMTNTPPITTTSTPDSKKDPALRTSLPGKSKSSINLKEKTLSTSNKTSASTVKKERDSHSSKKRKSKSKALESEAMMEIEINKIKSSKSENAINHILEQDNQLSEVLLDFLNDIWTAYQTIRNQNSFIQALITKEGISVLYQTIIGQDIEALIQSPRRHLIQSGSISTKKRGKTTKEKRYYLFTDVLLLTEPTHKKLILKETIFLKNVEKCNELREEGDIYTFEIQVNEHKTLVPYVFTISNYDLTFHKLLKERIEATGKLFGVDLETLMLRNDTINGIPAIVVLATRNLLERGKKEGIFRMSGNVTHLYSLREKLNQGEVCDFSQEDIHVISNILKLFLRELPVPVITFNLYQPIMDLAAQIKENEIEVYIPVLKSLLSGLPEPHYKLLFFLARFLQEMSNHSEITKMGIDNLSIILAGNIIRSENDSPEISSSSLPYAILILRIIITYIDKLFENRAQPPLPNQLLDEKWLQELSNLLGQANKFEHKEIKRSFSSPDMNSDDKYMKLIVSNS